MIAELERRINEEARHFNVSRSFVIATCCAYALRVTEQDDYATPYGVKTRRRKAS